MIERRMVNVLVTALLTFICYSAELIVNRFIVDQSMTYLNFVLTSDESFSLQFFLYLQYKIQISIHKILK